MNLGMVPAIIAAAASGAATVFFFYPPIYSFLVEDPQHLIELALFSFVAIVTGLLATNLRQHADIARRRETEMRELYAFSRRLVAAHTTSDIYTAIREHLASITGYRTILFEIAARGRGSATLSSEGRVPEQVKRAAELVVEGRKGSSKGSVVEDGEGHVWLVRAISGKGWISGSWRSILARNLVRSLRPLRNGSIPLTESPSHFAAMVISGVTANGTETSAPARFLFATEDGTIVGWNPDSTR